VDYSALGLWAALSAPFCATYAVAAANRARIAEAPRLGTGVTICIVLVAAAPVALAASAPEETLRRLALAAGLAYLAAFDMRAMAIPIRPTLIMIALALIVAGLDGVVLAHGAAALSGGAMFLAIDAAYRALRGRSGLGAGDALAAALLGAALGFEGLAWSVALGGAGGLIWSLGRRSAGEPLPFVPALSFGAAFYLIAEGWMG
jgi:leader peptidase (prepilin peptidase) / N-methyltransferase